MKIPDDVICGVCKKCFCCPECRFKHEIKCHAIKVRKPVTMSNGQGSNNSNGDDDSGSCGNANHATTIYLFCPICAKKPLLLKEAMYCEMLDHIKKNHLPLNCQKCFKIYTKVEDFNEFSKCVQPQIVCVEETIEKGAPHEASEQADGTKVIHTTIATQTSPLPGQNEFSKLPVITPVSMINLRLKAKTKITHEEFIGDSVSSIRNISSINNSSAARNIGILSNNSKGTLVRSTSTPLQTEIVITKPKERTFNVSAAVSSIYNSGSEMEGSSAPVLHTVGTPSQQSLELNRFRKVGGGRSKMLAATPLRQVMSKSVQKAIAEHGRAVQDGINRRKIFEFSDSSLNTDQQYGNIRSTLGNTSPLDLRLSPALRRNCNNDSGKHKLPSTYSQNNINGPHVRNEIVLSSQKTTTTESIVITRMQKMAGAEVSQGDVSHAVESNSKHACVLNCNNVKQSATTNSFSSCNSIYHSCRSVEIITSTETKAVRVGSRESFCSNGHASVEEVLSGGQQNSLSAGTDYLVPITPRTRIKGAVIKKNHILFETPNIVEESNSAHEAFFTPASSPVYKSPSGMDTTAEIIDVENCVESQKPPSYFSPSRRPSLRDWRMENVIDKTVNDMDDVSKTGKETNQQETEKPQATHSSGSTGLWSLMASVMRLPSFYGNHVNSSPIANSLIKRCSSIAGSIVRPKPPTEDESFQTLKRKRTYTLDSSSSYLSFNQSADTTNDSTSKRFRIHGRRPIQRMRLNS